METALDVEERGFAIIGDAIGHDAVARYCSALDSTDASAGTRNLLDRVPATRSLIDAANLPRLLKGIAGLDARIVRATLFDKSRGANWRVPWHQDTFVATETIGEAAGFSAWTTKDGVPHARAPREILQRMIAVRFHIDDCGVDDGPLRVVPGTHADGLLGGREIDAAVTSRAPFVCSCRAGSALLMRPLLLHASSPATSVSHRRVVHLDIADCDLPSPLAWHAAHHL
jgi:hypothetical protein